MTEGEMVGWQHQLNGYEFEQAPGDGEGQGRLTCCIPWGCKELDTTEGLILPREAITNVDSILKSRDITLPTKIHLVKAIVFPVVMYGCESWTKKKVEGSRIDAFKLWCLIKTLKSPLDSREIKPVNPKTN